MLNIKPLSRKGWRVSNYSGSLIRKSLQNGYNTWVYDKHIRCNLYNYWPTALII